ncbi:unnamed protein product [Alternaria alternata]
MAVARLQAILACLPCGTAEAKDETYPNEKAALLSAATSNSRLTAETADNVIAILLTTSLTGPALHMQLDSVVGASGWRSNMAKYVLEKLTAALQASHERLGPTIRSAYHRAWEAAQSIEGFVIEHPVMCTVIALGVLAVVAPWVLEALGFTELGPVQASSALEPVLEARSIRVLWAAWCDAVIAHSSKNKDEDGDGGDSDGGVEEPWPWVLEYMGTGLTTAQKECLIGDEDLKRAAPLAEAVLFGSAMHDGLRGYVVKSGNGDGDADADAGTGTERAEQKIVLFGTDVEIEEGVPEIQTFLVSESGFTATITDVAAGGYMSAAVSSDGELFVWGQACPGAGKELDVLKVSGGVEVPVTGIGVDEEQDEFVKCLDVRIDGQVARVYDVAVGHGHLLVAAELCETGEETKSVLFAAGDDSENQLGLETGADFKESFEEVTSLRGKRIVQLEAAGWSTYVVSLEK